MQYSLGVCVVDDETDLHVPIAAGLARAGLTARSFRSAEELLDSPDLSSAGCVVTDIKLPGASGLQLQQELQRRRIDAPVVVVSGQATVDKAVEAFRSGAREFFEKPICPATLANCVQGLVAAYQQRRRQQEEHHARLDGLTERELDVMHRLVSGTSVKTIARDLAISPSTVEKHRARILQKTQCDSVIELTRLTLGATA